MSDLDPITDVVARGLTRLPEQFKSNEQIRALVTTLLVHFQDAENALAQLYTLRSIDTATGAQLDVLGAIVGEPRGAHASDEIYRLWIRARIIVNRSNGLPEELLTILQLLDPTATTTLTEYYPAAYVVTVLAETTDPVELAAILRQVKPAGVSTSFTYSPLNPSLVFTLSDDDTTMTGDGLRGLASDDGFTSGGHLAGSIG